MDELLSSEQPLSVDMGPIINMIEIAPVLGPTTDPH